MAQLHRPGAAGGPGQLLSFRLVATDTQHCGLNLYAAAPRSFDERDEHIGLLFAAARLLPARGLWRPLSTTAGPTPTRPVHPDVGDTAVTRLRLRGERGDERRFVATALVGCARSQSSGVLVVGSRGRSAVREIPVGSVTMAALHQSYLPVLVVPSARPAAGDDVAPTASAPAAT